MPAVVSCVSLCVRVALRLSICIQTCIHTRLLVGGGGSDAHRRALLGAIINSSLTYNYGHPETTGNRFSLIVQVVSLLLLFGFSAASPSATFIMPSSSLSLSQLSSIRLPSVCVRVCFGSLGITHVNLITRRPCENQCAGSFGSISCQGTLIT